MWSCVGGMQQKRLENLSSLDTQEYSEFPLTYSLYFIRTATTTPSHTSQQHDIMWMRRMWNLNIYMLRLPELGVIRKVENNRQSQLPWSRQSRGRLDNSGDNMQIFNWNKIIGNNMHTERSFCTIFPFSHFTLSFFSVDFIRFTAFLYAAAVKTVVAAQCSRFMTDEIQLRNLRLIYLQISIILFARSANLFFPFFCLPLPLSATSGINHRIEQLKCVSS